MKLENSLDFFGRGMGLPFCPDGEGRMRFVEGTEKVRQAIFIILDTEPGERVMFPEFGCGLKHFLMQPNNPATRAQIEREVRVALQKWEPRIAVAEVDVLPGDDPALMFVEIRYAYVFSGRRDSFVYPFYLE